VRKRYTQRAARRPSLALDFIHFSTATLGERATFGPICSSITQFIRIHTKIFQPLLLHADSLLIYFQRAARAQKVLQKSPLLLLIFLPERRVASTFSARFKYILYFNFAFMQKGTIKPFFLRLLLNLTLSTFFYFKFAQS